MNAKRAKRSSPVYLLTGGTGFLGRHVLNAVQARSAGRCIVLVRNADAWHSQPWTTELEDVDILEATLTDPDGVARALERAGIKTLSGVFHLAALVRHSRSATEDIYRTNVDGTLGMLRVASRYGARMVYASTSGVVGCFSREGDWADEHSAYQAEMIASWPYYHSKLTAEQRGRELAAELGTQFVVLRPPVLLGPGDHRFRSSGHVLKMLRGKLPFLIQGGMHFADVRDVSDAIVAAMQHPAPRDVYHLPGTACGIDTFFGMIEAVSGVPAPKTVLPPSIALAAAHAGATVDRVLPGKKLALPDPVVVEMASKYWGLRSRWVEEELAFKNRPGIQTIADTVAWLRAHHPELAPTADAARAA